MKFLGFVALVCIAAPATAAPTYLSCTILAEKGPFPISLTVDEDAQSVTTAMPTTGHSQRLPAVFSPTSVSFRNSMLRYEVSRTDLTIKRVLTIGAKDWTDTGTCKVETPPARAF